jgi:ssDNA-binding Zn-finger/Zn-ribbon topoisomerase 1
MAHFEVFIEHNSGRPHSIRIEADSFSRALMMAHAVQPMARLSRVVMLDEAAEINIECPECHGQSMRRLEWRGQPDVAVQCPTCRATAHVSRDQPAANSQRGHETSESPKQVHGRPPQEGAEHVRAPSLLDRVRSWIENPEAVSWSCRACKWGIRCDWDERAAVQECPDCGCKQYVPGYAFAWNSRILRARAESRRAAEQQRKQLERANREQEDAIVQRRLIQAQIAQQEFEDQQRRDLDQLAGIAVCIGLIEDKHSLQFLDAEDIETLREYSSLADELHADLMAAVDGNVRAEKGVAYGRPAAAAAGVASALAGNNWAGLAFGALALGARAISDDWKRAKMAEYQAKWLKTLSGFSAEQMRIFSAVFAHKYPALASMSAGMLGRLPG